MTRIVIYAEELGVYTTSTPAREMLRELMQLRDDDTFVLMFHKGSDRQPWVKPYLDSLPAKNIELEIVNRSRRANNLLTLLGIPWTSLNVPAADVYIRFHLGDLGRRAKPMIGLVTDFSSQDSETTSVPWHGRVLFRKGLQQSVRNAAAIVAISDYTAKDLVDRYPSVKDRVRVIPNGIANQWFDPRDECACGSSGFWIWYGQVTQRKNLARLLTAYASLRTQATVKLPGIELIAGDGPAFREIERLISALKLSEAVTIVAPLPLGQLITRVRGSKGLLFPSLHEGFGMPIIEAMALGRPVLTANVTSMPEVAGGHAVLCNPTDIGSIEAGLRAMLTSEIDSCANQSARRKWASQFTARRAAEGYDALINQLTGKSS